MKKWFSRIAVRFDRSFSHSVLSQFLWLGGVVIAVFFVLWVLHFFLYDSVMEDDESRGFWFDIVMAILDPGYMTDRMKSSYVIFAALCGIIIFMGMFIPIVSNVLERHTDAVLNGDVSYTLDNHHVIVGYNRSVAALVQFIRSKVSSDDYIIIMSEQPADEIRANLMISLGKTSYGNVIILNGRRNFMEDLQRLSIEGAKSLWIIGEDGEEGHDSINFECARMVAEIRKKALSGREDVEGAIRSMDELSDKFWSASKDEKKDIIAQKARIYENVLKKIQLDCHIMFEQSSIYACFQYSDVTPDMKDYLNFLPFNPYENWAKTVLVAGPEKAKDDKSYYEPADTVNGISKDSGKHVHLIVIGMSPMGQALAVETAHTAHYPNFREGDMNSRTHITFIDCNAREQMFKFKSRFEGMFELACSRYLDTEDASCDSSWTDPMQNPASPVRHLGSNFIDMKWEFVNGLADSPAIQKYLVDAVSDENAITTIAVCLSDSGESMRIALNLPHLVYKCHQILVYQEVESELLSNLSDSKENLRQFGAMSNYYEEDKIGVKEGKWVNFFYADSDLANEAGADALWKEAKVADQWSSIHSANIVYTKLRCVGLKKEDSIDEIKARFDRNMDYLKVLEHNRWNADKLLSGFRALTDEEYEVWRNMSSQGEKDKEKNRLKKKEFAHLDICSFAQLGADDPATIPYDVDVTNALIEILKEKG